jgi:putative modified peptide
MAPTRLTPELVDKLLDKLGSDDHFREQFRRDPHAAMVKLGAAPDSKFGLCLRPSQLAPKKEIQETRALLRNKLLGTDGQEVQCLGGGVKP